MRIDHRNSRYFYRTRIAGWFLAAGFIATLLHPMLHSSTAEIHSAMHDEYDHHAPHAENTQDSHDSATPVHGSDDDCIHCVLLTQFSAELTVSTLPDGKSVQFGCSFNSQGAVLAPVFSFCQLRAPPHHA